MSVRSLPQSPVWVKFNSQKKLQQTHGFSRQISCVQKSYLGMKWAVLLPFSFSPTSHSWLGNPLWTDRCCLQMLEHWKVHIKFPSSLLITVPLHPASGASVRASNDPIESHVRSGRDAPTASCERFATSPFQPGPDDLKKLLLSRCTRLWRCNPCRRLDFQEVWRSGHKLSC